MQPTSGHKPALTEIRTRVIIDSDMPDLLARLANAQRMPREIVHLLRLGLQFEQYLNGQGTRIPKFETQMSHAVQGGVTEPVPSTPVAAGVVPAGLHTDLIASTGLDASFFAGPPQGYQP